MSHRRTLHQPSRRARAALAASLVLLVAACASAPRSAAETGHAPAPRASAAGPRDPITETEIARIRALNTYEVVRQLRGNFLASRGVTTFWRSDAGALPAVFVDGMHLGTLAELRSIPAGEVHEVRFLSAGDAMLRFGPGYTAGVIHVITKR